MTLALVIVIVFLVVWAGQVITRKANRQQYKNATRTDSAQQAKSLSDWDKKISDEINSQDIPYGKLFDFIEGLYTKYNMPFDTYVDGAMHSWDKPTSKNTPEVRAKDRAQSIESELDYQRRSARDKVFVYNNNNGSIKFNRTTEEEINFTNMQRVLANYQCACYYSTLLFMLTKHSLAANGIYGWSYGGKESEWQEMEKYISDIDDFNKQYPWLSPKDKK